MAAQTSHLEAGRTVKHFDFVVMAAADDPPSIVVDAGNAFSVTEDRSGTGPRRPIPNLEGPVPTSGYNLIATNLHGVNGGIVAVQAAEYVIRGYDWELVGGVGFVAISP